MSAFTYSVGTISVAAGATTATGTLTAWSALIKEGDLLVIGGTVAAIGADATAETSLTLAQPWSGSAKVNAPYVILLFSPRHTWETDVWADLRKALRAAQYITSGPDAPSNATGVSGDIHFRTVGSSAVEFRVRGESAWSAAISLVGPQGTQGAQGPQGPEGPQGPQGPAGVAGRETLTAARTYYVSPTGSDANNGLTVGAPFLTLTKAATVLSTLDCGPHNVTVSVAAGTFAEMCNLPAMLGSGVFTFSGAGVTTIVRTLVLGAGSRWTVTNCRFGDGVGAFGIECKFSSQLTIGAGCTFAATTYVHIAANGAQVEIFAAAGYTITGGGVYHMLLYGGGTQVTIFSKTITLTGTPAFTGGYIYASGSNVQHGYCTFTGAATGPRHQLLINTVVSTGSGTPGTYFPGSTAGSADATSAIV